MYTMKYSYILSRYSRAIIIKKDIPFSVQRRFLNESAEKVTEVPKESGKEAPLFDLHGRRHDYLRISLTERCNLRCQYCMPAEGVPLCPKSELMSREELFRAVRVMAQAGVTKLRLTGGEPTLRADLADIIQELNSIPGIESVSMTTNGVVLARRLPALQRAGLAHINISLDTLRPERYERMARRPGLPRVLAAIDLALQLGYRPLKINTVLMRGFNDDEILDFVEFTRDKEVEVRFIEFMPFSGNRWDDSRLVPYREALGVVRAAIPELQPLPLRAHHTARVWAAPAHAGTVGFISSMTDHFCGTCNRLRLTADGGLKVCLFGAEEVSLRDAIRAGIHDDDLLALARAALRRKRPRHAGEPHTPSCVEPPPAGRSTQLYSYIELLTGETRPNFDPRARRTLGVSRDAESRAHGEPADDSDRRVARSPPPPHSCGPFTAGAAGVGAAPRLRLTARAYSTRAPRRAPPVVGGDDGAGDALTHLDGRGTARMVDVGDKPVTRRAAVAECRVVVGARLVRLLRDARVPKGDALCVARVAGALAAKRTADLLPLCHPLALSLARVELRLPRGEGAAESGGAVVVSCEVRTEARTGAEMEALTGCAVAALAFYDMCKAVDKEMRITELRVVHKEGGRSERRPVALPDPPPRAALDPHDHRNETYAPTNLMHF